MMDCWRVNVVEDGFGIDTLITPARNGKKIIIRFKKGMRKWDMALLTRINQSKISLIENGMVEAKPHEKLLLSKALGVNVDDVDWKTPPSSTISIEG